MPTHLAHDGPASFRHSGTVIVWRDQAKHAAGVLAKGSRVVVLGRLQQRSWTAEDGRARSTVEVLAEELGRASAGRDPLQPPARAGL